MQTLTMEEVDQVSGGMSVRTAAKVTLGLMALAASSPLVMGVGCAALVAYALM